MAAPTNDLTWLGLDKPIFPYKTYTSPVDESPHWVTGSSNVMCTMKGYAEKRPGFNTPVELALSQIPGIVVRLYTWRRFSGSFFIMASVNSGNAQSPSQVWKLEVNVDQSFSMIYEDTTSSNSFPFDFVTSNNFCFFGNMTTRQNMRKFDGTKVTLWGLDFPIVAPAETLVSPDLPPGLMFNGGTLTGTPTVAGNYSITFTATDTAGDMVSQSLKFSISKPVLDWQSPSGPIPPAKKNIAYSTTFVEAWGGTTPYTYSLISGSLPTALSINPTTGLISGTPNVVGDYAFGLQVTDSASATITREFSLYIGDPSLAITNPSPNTGTVGVAYSSSILVSGGTAPYTYSLESGLLPPGLVADNAGVVSGTPTTAGIYPVTFQVKDSHGVSNQSTETFTVSSAILNIATMPAPPAGKVGYAYSFSPFASGGSNSVTNSTGTNTGINDWQYVGGQFRTQFEPAVTALADLTFLNSNPGIPNTATILGVQVSTVNVCNTATSGTVSQASLWYQGAVLGTAKTPGTIFTTTETTVTYGNNTDLWGATLTPAIVNDPSFGFSLAVNTPNRVFIGGPFQITIYYAYPSTGITLTAAADAITAQTGYIYGQTFTSVYGHESSMSALSDSTGVFTNLNPRVNILSSADTQVTGINLYRTTDGGAADPAVMRLVASLPNVDASYIDSTLDIDLGLQTGPALYINNPPQPLNGFVWSNGRIWGINASYTWFTGNEEVTNGIPEECMSNAANGNFYAWPSEVGSMAVTANGVDIGLDEAFWQISGDTLSTFRKSSLLRGGGTRYPINSISVGDSVLWIDTAKQIFSSSDGEIGETIRPDLMQLDLEQAFIDYHKSKLYNWITVLDALNSILYVYDLDLNQWNVPWNFEGTVTAITSGEIAVGQIQLIVAFADGHVLYLTPGTYLDDSAEYGETLKSNLFSIVPNRGTTARNAAEVRELKQFDIEVSQLPGTANDFIPQTPDYFGILIDDDPLEADQTDYLDLSGNLQETQYQDRTIQKKYMAARRWTVDQSVPQARRVAFWAGWNPDSTPWNTYTLDIAWRT